MTEKSDDTELRLYCIMRADLNAPIGKLMAQAGHAFVGVLVQRTPEEIDAYMNEGMQPKITKRAKNEHELLRAKAECEGVGIPCYLVTDAGRTVFLEPTVTCLGIGPVARKDLPRFIERLQLLERMKIDGE